MKIRYDYYEKIRQAVLDAIHQYQPVTLLQLTAHLAPTYSFQSIKNELKRLIADNIVAREYGGRNKRADISGATGLFYSIRNAEEVL